MFERDSDAVDRTGPAAGIDHGKTFETSSPGHRDERSRVDAPIRITRGDAHAIRSQIRETDRFHPSARGIEKIKTRDQPRGRIDSDREPRHFDGRGRDFGIGVLRTRQDQSTPDRPAR